MNIPHFVYFIGMSIFMGDALKIDEILSRHAREKEENLVKKRKSLSNIKSVIGPGERSSILSILLKINTNDKSGEGSDNPRKNLLKDELDIEDDDEDEQLKSLDHEEVCKFFGETIEPKFLRY